MLNINNVFVKYGDRTILDKISLSINEGDRVGLVGLNGAGKSTLLKIMAVEISPHSGDVVRPKGSSIGFLHQDMILPKGRTVLEETLSVLSEVKELEKQIEQINDQIETRTDYESQSYLNLFNELDDLNEKYRISGGQNIQVDAEKILMGLGFTPNDFIRPTDEFSGGWQMRIELTKMLLLRPDYLLLDEPTNHLDIESIIWLEQFLETFVGAVIVISHDKTFLDNVTKRTIEIELGKIYDYKANYSKFIHLQKERRVLQQNAFDNQQREIAKKEQLIERFRAKANKAKMAQSLIKELGRMDKIELDNVNSGKMKLSFPLSPRSGEIVVEVKGLSKSYANHNVLNNVDLEIIRGEKIAFVGKNGEGKSTLSKIILGHIPATGIAKLGYNIKVGYYAQNQAETLDPKLTVLETIEQVSPEDMRTKLRSILGSFLFSGEDVEKKVFVLSGGERARLALACMMLRPINLLVLDEPTNHLDIRSKEVLKDAIKRYDGTLIIVSHDRDFLDGLTEKVIEFNNKKLKTYLGDVQYFLEKRALDNFREVSLGKKINNTKNTIPKGEKKKPKLEEKEYQQRLRQLRKDVQNAERKINRLEEDLKKYESIISDMSKYGTIEYDTAISKHMETKNKLSLAMEKWENAENELEEMIQNKNR
ncbi:MAG: ATP-binding cassette domain-containing protein [Saprospiraceae bacterium]|nr:ATP-binding cassette domain-containing protein [Saprospiraceae bacterium]